MLDFNELRIKFNNVPKFEEYQLNKENIFKFKLFNDFQEGFITFSSYKTNDLNKAINEVKKVYNNNPVCDHYIIEVYGLNPKPRELTIKATTKQGINTGNVINKRYFYDWHKIKDLNIYLPKQKKGLKMDYCCINCGSGFEKEEIITINEDDFCNYCSEKVNENI